jgi:hypothetical protein
MKKVVFTIMAFIVFGAIFSQDLIYKKDGSEIKAEVTEISKDQIKYKKFDFQDGPFYTLEIKDVFMIIYKNGKKEVFKDDPSNNGGNEKVKVEPSDYGGDISIGVCLGGGGLVGSPFRFFPNENVALELGLFLRPVFIVENGNFDIDGINIAVIGGPILYFNKRYNEYKQRVQLNGMFLKAGFSSGSRINETIIAIGWAYERFKKGAKHNSVSFELGLGISMQKDKDFVPISTYYFSQDESLAKSTMPMIYWKLAWNFFSSKK